MKRKLYGNTITPVCALCIHGRRSADGRVILCVHKGVADPGDRCRKFSYDPLRRVPFRQPVLDAFTAQDFTLIVENPSPTDDTLPE